VSLHLSPFTSAGAALHPIAAFHPRLRADAWRPYIGILGVLLGSIMATLGSRVTSFGIADLRGGLHVGFDEGAWMTTSFGVGQMAIGVSCPYLGAIFGARRVLLWGIALFFVASLLGPLSPNHSFRSPSVSSRAACLPASSSMASPPMR
jgi:DHA2 family multidrug resistance protein